MADENIGNDEITEGKQQNNFEKDLESGINQAQGLYNSGKNIADSFGDSKADGAAQLDNKKEDGVGKDGNSDGQNTDSSHNKTGKNGAIEANKKGTEKAAEKSSEKAAEKSTEKAAEAGAEKAAEKVTQKAAEKGAEKAVEAAATAAGTAVAPGAGTVVGKVVGKTIVPIVKFIVMLTIFGWLLSIFVMQSLPSYIFNPTFGLNPEEHKISSYTDLYNRPKPEETYTKANADVKSELEKAKQENKLSGSASMDAVFMYACYSASMEQYAKCPENDSSLKISYKVDMILKIIKVLPKVLIQQVIGSTGSTSSSGSTTGGTTGSGDVGGGDYTLGSITQLVNKFHSVDASYEPSDLEQTTGDYTGSPKYLRAEANQAYSLMWADAQSKGFNLIAVSGYRSYSLQETLYGDGGDNSVAKPGQSEHQLGLALDISCASEGGNLEASFGDTPEGKYLAENAAQFGFIIRYPKDKESYTGYPYEPWHFRYVGVETAQAIKTSGLTMEGYYAQKAGTTIAETPATTSQSPTTQVTPFKKELFFEAFFGSKVQLTDKMEGSQKTYEEYIMYLAESMKKMLNITSGTITLGGYGGIYAWPVDKPLSEFTLADDDDWGWRTHPIWGDQRWHDGIDLTDALGSNIYAAQAGTVTLAGWNGGYGNYIRIDHNNGVITFYGHLSEIKVNQNDKVTKGQLIGLMGSTGDSTGSHLHFGASMNGESFDPLELYKLGGNLSDGDYNDLLKIVEAEATNQGYEGKVAVTQVIMFRVQVTGASYHDVIFADGQFSPITDGRFDAMVPTEETIQAVNDALGGKQVVDPRCYFFYNPDASSQDWSGDSSKIFDRRVGDHMFYLSAVYK